MGDKTLVERLRMTGKRISVPCPDGIDGCLVHHFRIETDPLCEEAATRIEALEERWAMIDKLRAAEGHSVTIIHDNPDFGEPNSVIHVSTSYGQDWEAYYGDTVDDCLRKAVEALESKP